MPRVAIIGAGFSGLLSAKTMLAFGHDITIFEKCPDAGGVWSKTRGYPAIETQNAKDTYYFSDLEHPAEYPELPKGYMMGQYFEMYLEKHKLHQYLRLNTEVVEATRTEVPGWTIRYKSTTNPSDPDANVSAPVVNEEKFDHIVVANGCFSTPSVPNFAGREEFEAAGGRVLHTSQQQGLDTIRDKHLLVIGFGKSACDLACMGSNVAASTTIVARELLWKIPRRIFGRDPKQRMQSRFGEAMYLWMRPGWFESWFHGTFKGYRDQMVKNNENAIRKQLKLDELDLVPRMDFERVVQANASFESTGLFQYIREGRIKMQKYTEIKKLSVDSEGKKYAELANGQRIPADIVICGTGFHQVAPFLPKDDMAKLTDAEGNWTGIHRNVLPIDVPNLYFVGYSTAITAAVNFEAAALYAAAHIAGTVKPPPATVMRQMALERFNFFEKRNHGKHAKNTISLPFGMHELDELLGELKHNISWFTRLAQWFRPVYPKDYVNLTSSYIQRFVRSS